MVFNYFLICNHKILIREMESQLVKPQLRHIEDKFHFGKLTDTPTLYYIPILDIDKQKINVPCTRLDITIRQLLEQYKANSSCLKLIKGSPCLRIAQGIFKNELALDTEKLSAFDLDYENICFYLIDSAKVSNIQSMIISAQTSRNNHGNSQIELKILFESKTYPLRIKGQSKLIDLKKKLISDIPALKLKSLDLLQIQCNGLFLIDDSARISNFNIVDKSVVLVLIKKKTGCFSRNCLITLQNGQLVTIDKIKIGDKVLSFNQITKQVQSDMVTHVQTAIIKEAISIQFQNGYKLQTTPNHMLLCEDGIYRCYTFTKGRSSLQEGTKLRQVNNEAAIIKSIINETVSVNSQTFYHLSTESNHNFIVNNLIAHNMFINVKLPTGDIEPVNITPHDLIIKIKQTIEQLYYVQVYNQKLIYIGKELNNYRTIADYNIPKEATLQLQYKITETTNAIAQGSDILIGVGCSRKVQKLAIGDEIANFDSQLRKLAGKKEVIQFVKQIQCNDIVVINVNTFNKQDEIILTTDSFLEAEDGQIYSAEELCYWGEEQPVRLRTSDGSPAVVVGTAHHRNQKNNRRFYKFITSGYNFIARSLILQDFMISVVFKAQNKRIKKITVNAQPDDSIAVLRGRLSHLASKDPALGYINISQIIFFFNQNKLEESSTLRNNNIQPQHVIVGCVNKQISKILKTSMILQSDPFKEKLQDKCINIQVSATEKYTIKYLQYRQKTVEQIIKQILPFQSSCYFFIYSNMLLFPTDCLIKLQEESQFLQYTENTVLMIKNEKLAFIQKMNIERKEVKNYTMVEKQQKVSNIVSEKSRITIANQTNFLQLIEVKQACSRITNDSTVKEAYKSSSFFCPFLYLTSRRYTQKINRYIAQFYNYKHQYNSLESVFTIIKDLYINMQLLPNYYGQCFMALKNFKFGRYFKKNHTFYMHSFTTAYRKVSDIQDELKEANGTLFRIRSLNGRNITQFSVYPKKQEIVFMPFTSFLVEGIIQRLDYDEVFLVQVSSPISFKKDIILWVDDNPQGNKKEMARIYQQLDVEILQATSTIQALKWIQEFGWILKWKGLDFRLVSDMGRMQGLSHDRSFNKKAGIDLLQQLYCNYGLTVRTMIYCGNQQRVRQMLVQAKMPSSRYFDVTDKEIKLLQFCKSNK